MDNRATLTWRIHSLDFALLELNLFLDTHPDCEEALCKRREYQRERASLIETYEAQYGPYIVTAKHVQGDRWSWVDGPWPWEYGREC